MASPDDHSVGSATARNSFQVCLEAPLPLYYHPFIRPCTPDHLFRHLSAGNSCGVMHCIASTHAVRCGRWRTDDRTFRSHLLKCV